VKAVGNTNRVPHVIDDGHLFGGFLGQPPATKRTATKARSQSMKHMETISDAALDQVTGGLSFSLDLNTGLKVESSLGSVSIASPITLATDLLKGVASSIGNVISSLGNSLVDIGKLFNFS
jgi:hypothetical protein